MKDEFVAPEKDKNAFNCPHCGAFTHHDWEHLTFSKSIMGRQSQCKKCGKLTIWMEGKLYYPRVVTAPKPHEEMPEDVERDFGEARLVVNDSPRAAAALLRLAIQRLVNNHLEAEGDRLYDKIGDLVEKGSVSPRIQKALDSVRVIGNNSVHPGEMDMDDDRETANALFKLTNAIVDETIGRDEMIDGIFDSLPEGPKRGIEQRDGDSSKSG